MTQPLPVTPAPTDQPPRRGGVAALVVAIVALVLALIPFASYVAGFVAIVAVVLGVIAVRRAVRKGIPIAAIVVGAVALILAIVMSVVYTVVLFVIPAAVDRVQQELPSGFPTSLPSDFPTSLPSGFPTAFPTGLPSVRDLSTAPESGSGGSVVFRVAGEGSAQTINYTVAGSDGAGNATVNGTALPWSRSVGISKGAGFAVYAVIAQTADGGSISCSITVNGKQVAKSTASGRSGVATCTTSG